MATDSDGKDDPDDAPTGVGRTAIRSGLSGQSGSMPVVFSDAAIVVPGRELDAADAVPEPVDAQPSEVTAPAAATTRHGERSGAMRAATERLGDGVSRGVGKVGDGISSIGGGIAKLGTQVARLPAGKGLGAGVRDLGAGVTDLGASLTSLPVMAKTRRGSVLVRGLVVGLALVALWIGVIVYAQLRSGDKPDLRPVADALLGQLRDGQFAALYEQSSPRFKELMIEDHFVDLMEDLTRSLGPFVEIDAVNDTLVTTGPGGRIARIDMLLGFTKGKAKSNLSLHWDERRWKLLGISVDLPDELVAIETSQEARRARVTDPAEVAAIVGAAKAMIAQLAADRADVVWSEASPVFQAAVGQADFARLEADRRDVMGKVGQYLDTTVAQTNPSKTSATVVALIEYELAVATTRFSFERPGGSDRWRLTSYKVVPPMPLSGPVPNRAQGSAAGSAATVSTPANGAGPVDDLVRDAIGSAAPASPR